MTDMVRHLLLILRINIYDVIGKYLYITYVYIDDMDGVVGVMCDVCVGGRGDGVGGEHGVYMREFVRVAAVVWWCAY